MPLRISVVACDTPFLTTAALDTLLRACGASAEADAIVAVDESGRRHPLCAVYAHRVAPVAEAQLRAGRYAVRDLLERLREVRTVRLDEAEVRNMNTPDDIPQSPSDGVEGVLP